MNLIQELPACRVLPVLTVADDAQAVHIATALKAGGMRAVEITLRTPAALTALRQVKVALPGLLVGAGTVTTAQDVERAVAAGADFCVSPGISVELIDACAARGMPFLPGVATASEAMLGARHGFKVLKLFPAAAAGGIALLKSLHGPFPELRFCPTGGLGPDNFRDYLALPNVVCCGGSWMVAPELVQHGRWPEIERLAREALRAQ